MSIIQFFRILWAYRLLTVVTTVATLIGAGIAVLIVPPSYEASTRVMLNVLKPDPITGEQMGDRARIYIETQRELIKDFGVAGQAVDQLGWTSLPETLQSYTAAGSPDGGIRRWLAQSIIDKTKTNVVGATNIMEISFRAATPTQASSMANALRDAYIESTISGRRREAMRNAEWFTEQADKERQALDAADQKKTAYEKETGIVMADEKTDIETSRLRSLSSQSSAGAPIIAAPLAPASASASAMQLAQLDAQIAQASKSLGANHPAMIEMNARRATVAKLVEQDRAAAREAMAASARAAGAGAGALNRAVAEQTSRVVAQREKIQHLTQLQQEVNLHRETMEKSLNRAAELRQEAAIADPGVTVLGEAVTPRHPAFPNKPLILGGGMALGAGLGLLLSLILELLNRRLRGVEDLDHLIDAPLLAVIPPQIIVRPAGPEKPKTTNRRKGFSCLKANAQRPLETEYAMTATALKALLVEPSETANEPRIQTFANSLVTLESREPASVEAFRALRTHVMAQHVEHGRRAVALCAPSAGVGCTFVAANLAIALSQIGVKTLLIDANLRHPGLEQHFTPAGGVSGLKQCLSDGDPISEHILPDVIPYLSLMFSGGVADDAQELLATSHFADLMGACMRDYDMTILDTPPANRCSDALRISNVVGYSVIVVRRDKTQLNDIRVLAGQLEGDGARVVGTVMTEA